MDLRSIIGTKVHPNAFGLAAFDPDFASMRGPSIVNYVSGLNPIRVSSVEMPETIADLQRLVREARGSISIAGGRFSMGGHTARDGGMQIDLVKMNRVISLSTSEKKVTVEGGIRWRELIEKLDPHDLSPLIMQSFANFSVGGAVSVNCHGRYMGLGPIVLAVDSIKVVLADGTVCNASRSENPDLFWGAIGGYGSLGVIAEVTLKLADNCAMERTEVEMPAEDYEDYFRTHIRHNPDVIFHNADVYSPYETVRAVSFKQSAQLPNLAPRLGGGDGYYPLESTAFALMTLGKAEMRKSGTRKSGTVPSVPGFLEEVILSGIFSGFL